MSERRAAARVGVCSWSLRAGSPEELADRVLETGLDAVQLALTPFADDVGALERTLAVLADSGVEVLSGMLAFPHENYSTLESIRRTGGVAPDEHWEDNLRVATATARVAARAGVKLVSFHAGFLPDIRSTGGLVDGRRRGVMIDRLTRIVEEFDLRGISTALETGQEPALVMLDVLREMNRPSAGVNFDPANFILYGTSEPVTALGHLAERVSQIHVKDAVRTKVPGKWGEEVPVGEGEVDWPAFFRVLAARGLDVDLIIEREAGKDRLADIRRAREIVERGLAPIP